MSPSRQWLILVVGIALMGLIYLLAPVITPFAVAAGLAYVGDPLVDRLQRVRLLRWQFSRTLAVVLVFLLMSLVIGLVVLLIIPVLIEQVRHLVERTPDIFAWLLDTAVPWLQAEIGLESSAFQADGLKQALRDYWKELSAALFDVMGSVTAGGQAVIFALLAGGQLFGFLGILLALPFAAALNVLVRYAHLRYRDSTLYSEQPLPPDEI